MGVKVTDGNADCFKPCAQFRNHPRGNVRVPSEVAKEIIAGENRRNSETMLEYLDDDPLGRRCRRSAFAFVPGEQRARGGKARAIYLPADHGR